MRWLCFLLVFCVSEPAGAGPWLRDTGKGFLSFSEFLSTNFSGNTFSHYSSGYLEYGLSVTTTGILSGGLDGQGNGDIFATVRRQLWHSEAWLGSYELGLGGKLSTYDFEPGIRAGLSIGRPLDGKSLRGWTSFDFFVNGYPDSGNWDAKLEATLGLERKKRRKALYQATFEMNQTKEIEATFTPSLVFPVFRTTQLQIGLFMQTHGSGRQGIKFSTWSTF